MMSVKSKNIHVLPTDKASKLYYWEGKLRLGDLTTAPKNLGISNQNIYITSDEEIKEGDYFIAYSVTIDKKPYISCASEYKERKKEKGKIILTTDQDLIKDGVQAINDEFLEWFVKNPSCDKVEIEYQTTGLKSGVWQYDYKIIIPKEEPKQETLEEAALKHCDMLDKFPALINPLFSFKEGAKWQQDNSNINALYFEIDALKKQIELLKYQQERMYSEEELFEMMSKCPYVLPTDIKNWYEKFKNK